MKKLSADDGLLVRALHGKEVHFVLDNFRITIPIKILLKSKMTSTEMFKNMMALKYSLVAYTSAKVPILPIDYVNRTDLLRGGFNQSHKSHCI